MANFRHRAQHIRFFPPRWAAQTTAMAAPMTEAQVTARVLATMGQAARQAKRWGN